jgi:hypothetical protein
MVLEEKICQEKQKEEGLINLDNSRKGVKKC